MDLAFNNREIATTLWAAFTAICLVIYILRNSDLRWSLIDLRGALSDGRLLLALMIAPTAGFLVAYFYNALGMLNFAIVKATVLWVLVAGVILVFTAINVDKRVAGASFARIATLSLVIEYLASYGRFELAVEIILLPSLLLVGIFANASSFTRATDDNEHQLDQIETFFTKVAVLAGCVLVLRGIHFLIFSQEAPNLKEVIAELSVPVVCSLVAYPALFALELWAFYESKLVRLRWTIPDERLRKYAIYSTLCSININRELAEIYFRLLDDERPRDASQVDQIMSESVGVWLDKRTRPNPLHRLPTFAEIGELLGHLGWKLGIVTGIRDAQSAISDTINWGASPKHATIHIEVAGARSRVQRLDLRMHTWRAGHFDEDIEQFKRYANALLSKISSNDFQTSLRSGDKAIHDGMVLWLTHDDGKDSVVPYTDLCLQIDLNGYDFSALRSR